MHLLLLWWSVCLKWTQHVCLLWPNRACHYIWYTSKYLQVGYDWRRWQKIIDTPWKLIFNTDILYYLSHRDFALFISWHLITTYMKIATASIHWHWAWNATCVHVCSTLACRKATVYINFPLFEVYCIKVTSVGFLPIFKLLKGQDR